MPDRPSIPYRVEPTATALALQEKYALQLEAGEETDDEVVVAGRLMLRRGQGKLAFGTLQDQTGRIQLFAPANVTPRFEDFTQRSLGDCLGVTGTVMKTTKGEL